MYVTVAKTVVRERGRACVPVHEDAGRAAVAASSARPHTRPGQKTQRRERERATRCHDGEAGGPRPDGHSVSSVCVLPVNNTSLSPGEYPLLRSCTRSGSTCRTTEPPGPGYLISSSPSSRPLPHISASSPTCLTLTVFHPSSLTLSQSHSLTAAHHSQHNPTQHNTVTMPETAQDAAPAAAAGNPNGFGENKGIKFHIKTGGKSYDCVLQDRSA